MTYTTKNIDNNTTENLSITISDSINETIVKVNIPIVPIPETVPKALLNPVTFAVSEQENLIISAAELASDTDGDSLRVTAVFWNEIWHSNSRQYS